MRDHDVLITSGGTSVGSRDLVPEVVDELGDPGVVVHGLAQKPDKPTMMAAVEGKPIFGLPGYPVSALMESDQLVAPYLREMSGEPEPSRKKVEARLTRKILSARGRRELVPVSLGRESEHVTALPLREGSGAITSLVKADGYLVVPLEQEIVNEDKIVKINMFGGRGLG